MCIRYVCDLLSTTFKVNGPGSADSGRTRSSAYRPLPLLLTVLLLISLPAAVLAWPDDAQWMPIYRGGLYVQDDNGDTNGSRNIVSDSNNAAAFLHNDGTTMFFRMRLDDDPSGSGGQKELQSFGWGAEFDTNKDASGYEWLIMVDGIGTEGIHLEENTVQGILGDPGDKSENIVSTISLAGNYRVVTADTSFNGDTDYFLDWKFPYATFKSETGLTDNDPIRIFEGSSSATNSLTENGADLMGASDLYAGFSDYMTPLGATTTNGTVKFVEDLAGSGDLTTITGGDTVYIRVDDNDRNYDFLSAQSITVTVTTPTGDTETVTLTETGINTGIFTGSIVSSEDTPTGSDGTLQVAAGETVTVTYVDQITANGTTNLSLIDTLSVSGGAAPNIAVSKSVSPTTAADGDTVTYTVTIANSGTADGTLTSVTDTLPEGFSYVTGSSSSLTTSNPSISGQDLTWSGSWTVPASGSVTLQFQATAGSRAGTVYNNVSASGSDFTTASSGDTAAVFVPTTGTVSFVEDLAGAGDVTIIDDGDTVYLRVDDADQNGSTGTADTVTVVLTNVNGDHETVTLTETGNDTGVFTGSIPSDLASASQDDGTLQVQQGETVTMTYTDAVDAAGGTNQSRTDTLQIRAPGQPTMSVEKVVTPGSAVAGDTVTYTITVTNSGTSGATVTTIQDTLPSGFSYVASSASGLTTADPTISGQQLTWSGSWSIGGSSSSDLVFQATAGAQSGIQYNNVSVSGSNFTIVSSGDTAPVTVTAPLMEITKSSDISSAAPGDEVIFTVYYCNHGDGAAHNIIVADSIPFYTTYSAGTLRVGSAPHTWSTADSLTDADDAESVGGVKGRYDGGSDSVIFVIDTVSADDSSENSGTDEGKVFFKVTVD